MRHCHRSSRNSCLLFDEPRWGVGVCARACVRVSNLGEPGMSTVLLIHSDRQSQCSSVAPHTAPRSGLKNHIYTSYLYPDCIPLMIGNLRLSNKWGDFKSSNIPRCIVSLICLEDLISNYQSAVSNYLQKKLHLKCTFIKKALNKMEFLWERTFSLPFNLGFIAPGISPPLSLVTNLLWPMSYNMVR